MTFKTPCLTMKASISRVTGLSSFKYEDLEEIAVFGQGSFGVVQVQVQVKFIVIYA